MKLDLHVHSAERSACGRAPEEDMIRAARRFGLDGLGFTDHEKLVPEERLEDLNRRHAPFKVFGGIEIHVVEGEDILVYGVRDPDLESPDWAWPDLRRLVRQYDGFAVLAHPFRFRGHIAIDVDAHPPDAIEMHSVHIPRSDERRIKSVAQRVGARLVVNSDAHIKKAVGIYYNYLTGEPQDERELVAELRAGAYTCQGMAGRLDRLNRSVAKREEEVRKYLAKGYDARRYAAKTGGSMTHFEVVRAGKSYRI